MTRTVGHGLETSCPFEVAGRLARAWFQAVRAWPAGPPCAPLAEQDDGVAYGSTSRDSRRTLHAGSRDKSCRAQKNRKGSSTFVASLRDLDGGGQPCLVRGPSSRTNHRAPFTMPVCWRRCQERTGGTETRGLPT